MLNSRIKHCKYREGIVFIHDEEGVNDLDETPAALNIRADSDSVPFIDKYLSWGKDDAKFFSSNKLGLEDKIVVTGSHRYDLLTSFGRSLYSTQISGIKALFGDFVLFNDNLAVDHYEKSYIPPYSKFNASSSAKTEAHQEWNNIVSFHKKRREIVRKHLIEIANSGQNIVVRPHPVYDPSYWYSAFCNHPNVHVIYQGCVEPWIHASSAVLTTGCTTGLQALLAKSASFELYTGKSSAFSSKILPRYQCPSDLSSQSISRMSQYFSDARNKSQDRWYHDGSSTKLFSKLIDDALLSLRVQKSLDWINNVQHLAPSFPKWRDLNSKTSKSRFNDIRFLLEPSLDLKFAKIANALYAVYT